ncbi:MAG: hypothetical protein AAGA75_08525, partial [Cyanobacteria bacterium P01_E01_bin.6]
KPGERPSGALPRFLGFQFNNAELLTIYDADERYVNPSQTDDSFEASGNSEGEPCWHSISQSMESNQTLIRERVWDFMT